MDLLVNVRFARAYSKIRCERRLPRPGDTTVRVGNSVAPNQVVARIPERVKFYIVPGNELLGVPPDAVTDYLLVDIGDRVEMGAPLLQKKGLWGYQTIEAPVAGTVSIVQNGRIIIESIARLIELRAMVKGRVVNLIGNRTIVLETQGTLIQGIWSTGAEAYGPLRITVDQPDQPLTASSLDKHERHILVSGTIQDETLLEQAAFEEVTGLITGSMPAHLCQLARRLRLPVILTDGIGTQPMAQPLFDLLSQWAGHETSLLTPFDRTYRPEIVIPHQVTADSTSASSPSPSYQPLAVGQTVRLLRAPYQGQLGQVIRLMNKARPTKTGLKAAGAMVTLADEQTVFVPYTNLEAIL